MDELKKTIRATQGEMMGVISHFPNYQAYKRLDDEGQEKLSALICSLDSLAVQVEAVARDTGNSCWFFVIRLLRETLIQWDKLDWNTVKDVAMIARKSGMAGPLLDAVINSDEEIEPNIEPQRGFATLYAADLWDL